MDKKKILKVITKVYKITDKEVSVWNKCQSERTGIVMTNQQMLDVILAPEQKHGKDFLIEAVTNGFETDRREDFQDMLAQKLLGKNWCTTRGTGIFKEPKENFMKELHIAAIEAGYTVLKET